LNDEERLFADVEEAASASLLVHAGKAVPSSAGVVGR
jgi:hypothetical protein